MTSIAVVGGGVAGLAAAHLASEIPGACVTVLEAAGHLGGRADVTDAGGEHCPRFFLDDYDHFLDLMDSVPVGDGTVREALVKARRFSKMPSGAWVEIDHLYASRADTVRLRDKIALSVANQRSLLIAKRAPESGNSFGAAANFSARGMRRVLRSLERSREGYVLPGATDTWLIDPWTRLLTSRGVIIRTGTTVQRIALNGLEVLVETGAGQERFDYLIVTAFAPDAYRLLDDSGAVRRLDWRMHTHCKCLTIDLDAREPVLAKPGVRVYSRIGMTSVVQPDAGRALVLATTLASTATDYMLACAREDLGLEFAPRRVRARDNLAPAEAVFIGDYVDPRSLSHALDPSRTPETNPIQFAGSYTHNSYPVDSAEAACRAAHTAVDRIRRQMRLDTPMLSRRHLPDPLVPEQRVPYRPAGSHPNATSNPRAAHRLWRAAVAASRSTALPLVRMTFVDESGCDWPLGEPAVYVATHRSIFDVVAGLLTFDHLGTEPHLVVAQKYFKGTAGRALAAIGAIPAQRGSNATIVAAIAAARAGASVAFMVEGRITARDAADTASFGRGAFEVCRATGAPLVPLVSAGIDQVWPTHRPWPLVARRRTDVVVTIGEPLHAHGRAVGELDLALRAAFAHLQGVADDTLKREVGSERVHRRRQSWADAPAFLRTRADDLLEVGRGGR